MSTKVVIMFPYRGYDIRKDEKEQERIEKSERRKDLFWKMVKKAREIDPSPVIILNRDTEIRDEAKAFIEDPNSGKLDVQKVWAVDTCQMWLSGWGYVIDTFKNCSRIVQLPGDIVDIEKEKDFFGKLVTFLSLGDRFDMVVGDFEGSDPYSAKNLIDQFGTYVLLANWFPDVMKQILSLPLRRPRSEFLNLKVDTLKKLLRQRKFAYEQTLNMLIRSWDFENNNNFKYEVHAHELGRVGDESAFRQYKECLDQIERTERMLKLLWREINEHKYTHQEFIQEYHRRDRISTASRETAAITIRSLLGLGEYTGNAGTALQSNGDDALSKETSDADKPEGGTAQDLLGSSLVGLWENRDDIKDPGALDQELREKAQRRID